jgi:glycosyltransferase involved in cell wall biosynthesis
VTGTLVPHGDVAALATALRDTLTVPGRAREWGDNGRGRVQQEFSLEAMAGQYHRLYQGS